MTKHTPTGANRDAWQKGYDCFQPDGQAGPEFFLQLLDHLPKYLHKSALDGWTTAIADHNTRALRKIDPID